MRKQLQQLNSSTAQQLNSRIASFMATVSMAVTLAGCGEALTADASKQLLPMPLDSPVVIDAGVVFADRESYLCLRFDQVGLSEGARVASATSSCECIQPELT